MKPAWKTTPQLVKLAEPFMRGAKYTNGVLPINQIDHMDLHEDGAECGKHLMTIHGGEGCAPHVQKLMEAIQSGATMSPVPVFQYEGRYVAMDGNHRIAAALKLGHTHVPVMIKEQTQKLGKSQREKEVTKVASVAAFRRGKLLFGRRADNGKWTLPGGHLEVNEKPAKGAVRELIEETGLQPKSLTALGDEVVGDVKVYAFLADIGAGSPTAENDPDAEMAEFRWVDFDDIPAEITGNLHSPKNVTLKLLGLQDWDNEEEMAKALPHFNRSHPTDPEQTAPDAPYILEPEDYETHDWRKEGFDASHVEWPHPVQQNGSLQADDEARVQNVLDHWSATPGGAEEAMRKYPIIVMHGPHLHPKGEILDGYHRLEAWRRSGHQGLIPAVVGYPKAALSKADGGKKPDKVGGNIIGVHNLSEGNLAHAHELGGLAAPSLAVAHEEHPFDSFGEVTLIAPKHLMDPKHTPVFDADIYSPRHPRAKYAIDEKNWKKIAKELAPHASMIGHSISDVHDKMQEGDGPVSAIESYYSRPILGSAYLAATGRPVQPVMRPARMHYEWSGMPAMRDFVATHGIDKHFDYDGPYHKALTVAARKAIEQWRPAGDDEEFNKDLREAALKHHFNEDGQDGLFSFGGSWKMGDDLEKFGQTEIDKEETRKAIEAGIAREKEAFEAWAKQKLQPAVGARYIPKHTDGPRGPGVRKIPYTLENILKEVTKKIRQGENFNYGLGTARAAGAKRFRTLEQMREHALKGKIVSTEEFQAKKKALDERFNKLVDDVSHFHADPHGFYVMDGLAQAIGDSYKPGKGLYRALQENGFDGVDGAALQRIAKFRQDLLDMPTEYFEAKPQRIVRLNEFEGAVVPHDVSPKTLEILAAHGINHIEKYQRNDPKSRWQAVNKVARAKELHLQEIPMEKMAIRDFTPGKPITVSTKKGPMPAFDYTHLLPEEHRAAGYSLRVRKLQNPEQLWAEVMHGGKKVGFAEAFIKGNPGEIKQLQIYHTKVQDKHQGKKLGLTAYEALMTHAFHVEGVHMVSGKQHSTLASLTHRKIADKHGMDYKPEANTENPEKFEGAYDRRFGPYEYVIKDEMEMSKAEANFDEVDRLLEHPNPVERQMALKLASVTPWHLSRAIEDPEVAPIALQHPLINEQNLMRVATNSTHAWLWPVVASHPKCKPEHIQKMAQLGFVDADKSYGMAVAAATPCKHTPSESILLLLGHPHTQEQGLGLLKHPNLTPEHAGKYAETIADSPHVDQHVDEIKQLIANPNLPTHALSAILDSRQPGLPEHVQRLAFHHPNVDPKKRGDETTRLHLMKFECDVEEWLVAQGLKKAEESNLLGGLQPNADILRDMHGFQPQLEAAFEAARFLIGGSEAPIDAVRRALWEEDGDIYAAALRAYNIPVTDDNLRALKAVLAINETKKAEQAPPILPTADVKAAQGDGEPAAEGVRRALRAQQVMTVQLGGKHSKGSVVARDPETKQNYLLKPGSGPQSPAAGAREDSSSQSQREAAFWHMARVWGVDRDFPRCDLILIDGKQYACMHLLDWNYKPMEKMQEKNANEPRRDLEPYRQRGDLHRWAVIDFVLGNPDRHAQNIMVNDKGDVKLIDHGSAFAGNGFNPSFDRDSFIPFYLRYATPLEVNFNKLDVQGKLKYMQQAPETARETIKRWVATLRAEDLEKVLPLYGIDPGPEIERLSRIKSATGPLDVAINQLWAGT